MHQWTSRWFGNIIIQLCWQYCWSTEYSGQRGNYHTEARPPKYIEKITCKQILFQIDFTHRALFVESIGSSPRIIISGITSNIIPFQVWKWTKMNAGFFVASEIWLGRSPIRVRHVYIGVWYGFHTNFEFVDGSMRCPAVQTLIAPASEQEVWILST